MARKGATSSAAWVGLSRAASNVFQLLSILVATRYLDVATFGLFALMQAIAFGGTRVANAGWREYVIQAPDAESRGYAYLLSMIVGAIVTLVICAGAALVSLAGVSSWSDTALFWLLVSTVGLGCIIAVKEGELTRQGAIPKLYAIMILGDVASFVVVFIAFQLNLGIAALVISRVAASAILVIGMTAVGARIKLRAAPKPQRKAILLFARRFAVSEAVRFLEQSTSIFAISLFLGLEGTGLYRAASRLSGAITEILAESQRVVSWQVLLRAREQPDPASAYGPAHGRLLALAIYLALPCVVGLVLVAEPLIGALLGQKWIAATLAFQILACSGLFLTCAASASSVLVVTDRASHMPWLAGTSLAFTVVSFLVLAPFGLAFAAAAQALANTTMALLWLGTAYRSARFSLSEMWGNISTAVISSIAMAAVLLIERIYIGHWESWTQLIVLIPSGAAAYITCASLLGGVGTVRNLIRQGALG